MGGEEKKEVSLTLKKLRQRYDNIHKLVRSKEKELEEAKKKLEGMGEEELNIEDSRTRKDMTLQDAQDTLDQIRSDHDYEQMFQRSYYHMLDRMKKDLIAQKITANDLHSSYKQKQSIASSEVDGSRKSKELRMQAKMKLDKLMLEIDLE